MADRRNQSEKAEKDAMDDMNADDDEDVVYDRKQIKQRAVVQKEVILETPNDDKVESKEVELYDVEAGDAKVIDSAFQINFTIDNYEFKDMEEHVVVPKGCLGKFHVSVDMPKSFECGFNFDDANETVSEVLSKGDTWFYLFDRVGEIEFEDTDNDDLGCIVTVLDIDGNDKKMVRQTEKARKKYQKWCDRRNKELRKKEQKENAEILKKKKIEDAAEKRYLKDSEKVAKKEAKMVNQDFNFDMSEDDIQRQQAVSQSLAMYNQMRQNKLQG